MSNVIVSFCSSLTASPKAAAPYEADEGLNNEMRACDMVGHRYRPCHYTDLLSVVQSTSVNLIGDSIDWSLLMYKQLRFGESDLLATIILEHRYY